MADGERLGASFAIDITNLKAGLSTANKLIRESQSEFREAAAGMDDWTKSEEGLTKKQKALTEQIGYQKEKVSALIKEKERIIETMTAEGKSNEEIQDAVDGVNKQIERESKQLDSLKNDLGKTETALEKLESASEEAGDAVEETGEAAEKSGDGFTIAKGAIADLISDGIQKLVGACKNAISSVAGLAESTRESRTAFAKLENAFDTAGFSAETAEKTMGDLYGVLGDTDKATEAANLIAKMSKSQEDLDKNTRILTGVFAEYGDSIPTEGLAEAMSATSAMSSVQGVLADALEWQGVNLDDYNEKLGEMSTEAERSRFIQETLTAIYGKSADKYRENNSALIEANDSQLEYTKTLNAFGEKVEPITTKVREGFNKILEKVLELVDGVDFDSLGETIDSAFDTFIEDILPKIVDGLEWIVDHKDELIAGIAGIGAAFAAFKVVSLIQSVTGALKGMSLAQAALNLVMSLNPIGLVVAAVAGLVAAFVVLWNKCEGFREFWINLWDNIKTIAVNVWDSITETFSKAWDAIKEAFSTVGDFFKNCWDSIKNAFSSASNWFSEIFTKAWNGIKNAFSSVKTFFTEKWNAIKNIFSPIVEWFKSLFSNAWDKIKEIVGKWADYFNLVWETIKGIFAVVKDVLSGDFSAAWDKIKEIVGQWASYFSGIWETIKGVFSAVASWFGGIFSDAWQNIKDAFSTVGDFFSGLWDTITSKFTTIGTNIADAVSGAFKSGINSVIGTIENTVNSAVRLINGAIDLINKLPKVNVGYVSELSLPRLAKGGVVSGATAAIVGEDGAEAVVPLEKNLAWLDVLADKLSEKTGGKSVVVNQTNNYSQAHSRYEIYKSKQQTAAAVRLALQGG